MADMEKEKQEIPQDEEKLEEAVETDGSEDLQNKEEAATDAAKEANDKYMRLAADFQNYKRRTENERQEIAGFANERIAKDLLPVIDSFERALDSSKCSDESFKNGVDLIYKQLVTVLTNFGVEAIKTDEVEFDPNFHDAVMTEEADGVEAGKILMVMQKGYTLNSRVIRPAMVKVSM